MGKLPPEVLEKIEARRGRWSGHASICRDALDFSWDDVIAVARSASSWKREADELGSAADGWKDTSIGRDISGRELYVTGKWVYLRGEHRWYVVTIHQSGAERAQRSKRR